MSASESSIEVVPQLLRASRTLKESVQLWKSRAGSVQTLRTWQPLQDALPAHVDRMERLVNVLRIFHSRRMLPADHSQAPPKLSPLLDGLRTLEDKLLNRPGKVMEGNTWAKCNTGLTSSATALEANLQGIWSDYISQLIPNLDALRPFLNLDRCAVQLRKITDLQNDLESFCKALPDGEHVFQQAEEKSREIGERLAKLDLGDVPPAVKSFIERVNSLAGANLGDLTDEVLSWLREKNLMQSFRVSSARR